VPDKAVVSSSQNDQPRASTLREHERTAQPAMHPIIWLRLARVDFTSRDLDMCATRTSKIVQLSSTVSLMGVFVSRTYHDRSAKCGIEA
jgi:hypothetical protein